VAIRRVVLLDALGTLVALEPPAPQVRRLLAERFGIEVTDEQARAAIAAEIAHYRRRFWSGRDAEAVATLRADCAEVLRRALPPSPALAAIPTAGMTGLLLDALRFHAFPEVPAVLAQARRRGLRLVVVSNWDASLPEVIERVGLAPALDGVVTSAVVGAAKPSPEIFAAGLALAGATAPEAIHVGDTFAEDVEGARAAGIAPILIARDGSPGPHGVTTIQTLDGLLVALDGLLPAP
jgi:putative hydrolase of the HAD superfamily